MTGKAGFGLTASSAGPPSLSLRYWRTQSAYELLVAATSHSTDSVQVDATHSATVLDTQLRAAIGILYRIADHPHASLAVGLRPWILYEYGGTDTTSSTTKTTVRTGDNFPLRWGVEVPLQAEMFLTDHFGLLALVSLSFGTGAPLGTPADQLSLHAQNGSKLIMLGGAFGGGVGASYYF